MIFKKVNITTARIEGLEKQPYYFNHKCYWAWDIIFSDTHTFAVNNLTWIKMGDSEREAIKFCNGLKKKFNKANIYEGNKVALIFENEGRVIAIGSEGKDKWIDVRDKFKVKSFKDLNIVVTSLKVY